MNNPEPFEPMEALTTDGSLLRRFRSGEQEAAAALYHRYAEKVHAVAKARTSPALAPRLDAEDVVQSVFRTFFRRAADGQYEAPDGAQLWNLLHVISLNKIRSLAVHHRAAKRSVTTTVALDNASQANGEEEQEAISILRMAIDDTIDSLPADQQRMVRLRIEGHNVADIAAATSRSKRSVERLLHDFRYRLSRLVFQEPH